MNAYLESYRCWGKEILGADGTALGTGTQNIIYNTIGCLQANVAAKVCTDLTLNGYSFCLLDELTL